MPRPKGPGAPGLNRPDLPTTLPAQVVPSKQYGQSAAELTQQKQIPMASGQVQQPTPAPPPGVPGVPGGGPPAAGGGMPGPLPGELTSPSAPTQRPNEPVTAGLPNSPGAGPEALAVPDPREQVAAILNQLGGQADPDTKRLRDQLNQQIANKSAA